MAEPSRSNGRTLTPRILLVALLTGIIAVWYNQHRAPLQIQEVLSTAPKFNAAGQSTACIALANELPGRVYSEEHPTFTQAVTEYWSTNACELRPSCIVRLKDAQDVSTAVKLLKSEYERNPESARFAVRSGGHSPEANFASINGGALLDLSLLNGVELSEDKTTTAVGVGARWRDVSTKLDHQGVAILGGRNAQVGVGGLILGGGVSYFSPRFGLVCDNIDEYEIVLADGTITRASSTHNADLWRALKGGTGNFGIVTKMIARTITSTNIWHGYAFWMYWQAPRLLEAFYNFNKPENFDPYAAGPIVSLTYVQSVGLKMIAVNLSYTKPEVWAPVFKGFKAIWRIWSWLKVQSLSEATEAMTGMAPYGQRQFQVTATIKNDRETINAIREIFDKTIAECKKVKSGIWSLVLQPLSAAVTRKGSPNVLGLETRHANDTLIIVLLAVQWADAKDDEFVHQVSREFISLSEEAARERGTADPYKYLNYAASGQDPFDGYGQENKRFMQDVSRKYDPSGFWQRAKQGGFKLDLY